MGKNRAKTTEEFINQLEAKYPGKYTILGEYVAHNEPIKVRYNECGHVNMAPVHSLYKGCGCGICRSPKRMNHQRFVDMIEELYPDKYEILGEYTRSEDRIKVKYKKCGHIAEPKAAYLRQGAGCPICTRGTVYSQDEFETKFHEACGDEFEPLEEYTNRKTSIKIKHITCGTVFSRNPGVLVSNGCRCPKCTKEACRTLVPGVNDIFTANKELFDLLKNKEDGYNNASFSREKAWFVCPDCGYEQYKQISYVANGGLNCPLCNKKNSYGERFIANVLYKSGISFEYQYSPEWIKPYFYDFMIEVDGAKYIIEVDGNYHFNSYVFSMRKLSDIQERDSYKQEVAIAHGYEVIRINYNYSGKYKRDDKLISSILESKLSQLIGIDRNSLFQIAADLEYLNIKEIVNIWNELEDKSFVAISERLGISDNLVTQAMYLACDLGLIKEDRTKIKEYNRRHGHVMRSKVSILCVETGEVFRLYSDIYKKYGIRIHKNSFKKSNTVKRNILINGEECELTFVVEFIE